MKCFQYLGKTGLLVWMICFWASANAQRDINKDVFLKDMSLLKESFFKGGNVSFDMTYYYSNEHTPKRYTDSVKGKIEIEGKKSRIVMDNTETISTGKYTIILVKEDKLMYLAKSIDSLKEQLNPLAAMDSIFSKIAGLAYHVTTTGKQKNYILEFPPGYPCKKMEIVVDEKMHRVVKTTSTVKTADVLQDPGSYNNGDKFEAYTNIETRFTNYRFGAVDTTPMNEGYYFAKEGNDFKVSSLYKGYTIYKGMKGL